MEAQAKHRCRAIATKTDLQCQNKAAFGTPYCWYHQAKISALILFAVGWFGGFFSDIAKDKFRASFIDPSPKLSAYLNGERLTKDNVFIFEPRATNYVMSLKVVNEGSSDAIHVAVAAVIRNDFTNRVEGSGWRMFPMSEKPEGGRIVDSDLVNFRIDFINPVRKEGLIRVEPLKVNVMDWKTVGLMVRIVSTDKERQDFRVHLVRQFGSNTNTLHDSEAVELLRKRQSNYSGEGRLFYKSTLLN